MENASKALIIAGAILISILIIAIGIYIYSSSTNSINTGLNSMSTQEKETFNNQYITYEGTIYGSQVKSLISKAISNADTYKDEKGKIVNVDATGAGSESAAGGTSANLATYATSCSNISKAIGAKKLYDVSVEYNSAGIVGTIKIKNHP